MSGSAQFDKTMQVSGLGVALAAAASPVAAARPRVASSNFALIGDVLVGSPDIDESPQRPVAGSRRMSSSTVRSLGGLLGQPAILLAEDGGAQNEEPATTHEFLMAKLAQLGAQHRLAALDLERHTLHLALVREKVRIASAHMPRATPELDVPAAAETGHISGGAAAPSESVGDAAASSGAVDGAAAPSESVGDAAASSGAFDGAAAPSVTVPGHTTTGQPSIVAAAARVEAAATALLSTGGAPDPLRLDPAVLRAEPTSASGPSETVDGFMRGTGFLRGGTLSRQASLVSRLTGMSTAAAAAQLQQPTTGQPSNSVGSWAEVCLQQRDTATVTSASVPVTSSSLFSRMGLTPGAAYQTVSLSQPQHVRDRNLAFKYRLTKTDDIPQWVSNLTQYHDDFNLLPDVETLLSSIDDSLRSSLARLNPPAWNDARLQGPAAFIAYICELAQLDVDPVSRVKKAAGYSRKKTQLDALIEVGEVKRRIDSELAFCSPASVIKNMPMILKLVLHKFPPVVVSHINQWAGVDPPAARSTYIFDLADVDCWKAIPDAVTAVINGTRPSPLEEVVTSVEDKDVRAMRNALYPFDNNAGPSGGGSSTSICRRFLMGKCERSDCRYLHPAGSGGGDGKHTSDRPLGGGGSSSSTSGCGAAYAAKDGKGKEHNSGAPKPGGGAKDGEKHELPADLPKGACVQYWLEGKCARHETGRCKFKHEAKRGAQQRPQQRPVSILPPPSELPLHMPVPTLSLASLRSLPTGAPLASLPAPVREVTTALFKGRATSAPGDRTVEAIAAQLGCTLSDQQRISEQLDCMLSGQRLEFTLNCTLNGHPARALLDTAAHASTIPLSIFEKIKECPPYDPPPLAPPPVTSVGAYGGGRLAVKGVTWLSMRFIATLHYPQPGDEVERISLIDREPAMAFLVVDGAADILIGLDALAAPDSAFSDVLRGYVDSLQGRCIIESHELKTLQQPSVMDDGDVVGEETEVPSINRVAVSYHDDFTPVTEDDDYDLLCGWGTGLSPAARRVTSAGLSDVSSVSDAGDVSGDANPGRYTLEELEAELLKPERVFPAEGLPPDFVERFRAMLLSHHAALIRDKRGLPTPAEVRARYSTLPPELRALVPPFQLELKQPGVFPPVCHRPFPQSAVSIRAAREVMDAYVRTGVCEETTKPAYSRLVVVPKPDGSRRVCQCLDAVALNEACKRDPALMDALPADMKRGLQQFQGAELFCAVTCARASRGSACPLRRPTS